MLCKFRALRGQASELPERKDPSLWKSQLTLYTYRTMMFVAFYACCIPIALWRLIKYPTARTWILFRPALVIALRIAGNVLRYMEATSNSLAPNKGRIVAEQVSLSAALLHKSSRPRKLIPLALRRRSSSFSGTSSSRTRCSYCWRVSLHHARPSSTTVDLDHRTPSPPGCLAPATSSSSRLSSSHAT